MVAMVLSWKADSAASTMGGSGLEAESTIIGSALVLSSVEVSWDVKERKPVRRIMSAGTISPADIVTLLPMRLDSSSFIGEVPHDCLPTLPKQLLLLASKRNASMGSVHIKKCVFYTGCHC